MDTSAPRDYDVVVPTTGKHWAYLLAALESIEGQSVPPTRIIAVVDGDHGVAERLQQRGGLDVLLHETRRGEAAARQTGITAATSSWTAFLDDDDLWLSAKQERLFAYLDAHPECRAVRAGYWMFAPPGGASGLFGQTPEVIGNTRAELEVAAASAQPMNDLDYLDIEGRSLELMLERNRGVIGTSMVATEILHSLPHVPEGLSPGADYLLFCHVAAATEWHLLRERLEFYRLHPGQDSRKPGSVPALSILRAKRLAWAAHGEACRLPLASYGRGYADEVRQFWWTVLRQTGSPREALRVYLEGLPLLPRWRDQIASAFPEPAVWRVRSARARLGHESPAPCHRPSW
jgi:glycosyltransferase involved in cell wall biosynthesis